LRWALPGWYGREANARQGMISRISSRCTTNGGGWFWGNANGKAEYDAGLVTGEYCGMNTLPGRYLELLKKSLLNELYVENEARLNFLFSQLVFGNRDQLDIDAIVADYVAITKSPSYPLFPKCKLDGTFVELSAVDSQGKTTPYFAGRNIVFVAHSMIGRKRMNNLHECMERVVADAIPGDFIETGVWKGGATIFMRGFLQANGIGDRKVWVADSFEGLPPPGEKDQGMDYTSKVYPYLAVGLDEVQELFRRYELLDDQVVFLKGWFKDTLPAAPIEKLAVLRLDGDLYSSTWDALSSLYPKLSPGGFVIVDDYFSFPGCQDAVDDYRMQYGVTEALTQIDGQSVIWRKAA
jgi:O-methyltransferase